MQSALGVQTRKQTMTRPWHSSRLLRIGLVGLCLLLAAWPLSFYRWSSYGARCVVGHSYLGCGIAALDGSLRIWAGNPIPGMFGRRPTGLHFDSWPPPPGKYREDAMEQIEENEAPFVGRYAVSIKLRTATLSHIGFLALALWWWQRRKRRIVRGIEDRIRRQDAQQEGS